MSAHELIFFSNSEDIYPATSRTNDPGVCVIQHIGAVSTDLPVDVCIIVERAEVLKDSRGGSWMCRTAHLVCFKTATWRFEQLQKLLEFNSNRFSTKIHMHILKSGFMHLKDKTVKLGYNKVNIWKPNTFELLTSSWSQGTWSMTLIIVNQSLLD